jgi:hypothetical protein
MQQTCVGGSTDTLLLKQVSKEDYFVSSGILAHACHVQGEGLGDHLGCQTTLAQHWSPAARLTWWPGSSWGQRRGCWQGACC